MLELWQAIMPIPVERSPRVQDALPAASAIHALIVRSVLQVSADIQKRMDGFVRPYALTMQRMGVLLILFFSEQQLSPSELGDKLFVTRGNMTGLVEGLVTEGLVRRVRRANDRRAHDLALTERGAALVHEYLPHHRRALTALMQGLTESEGLALAKLLQKLRAGMQTLEPVQRAGSGVSDSGRELSRRLRSTTRRRRRADRGDS